MAYAPPYNPNLPGGWGLPGSWAYGTGAAGAPNNLPGAPSSGYDPRYGGIPQVPNPAATANDALSGNIHNAGSIEELMKLISQLGINQAGQVNKLNLGQAGALNTMNQGIAGQNEARYRDHAAWLSSFNEGQAQRNAAAALLQARATDQQNQEMIAAEMEANIPGYKGVIGQRSHNIADELAGNVSDSTWNQLAQRAAERGASMGTGVDSPGRNAALLAALGQTSEQQQARGASELGGAIAGVPHAPLASVPIMSAPFASAPYEAAPYANPPYASAQQLDLSNFLVRPEQQQEAQGQANWNAGMPVPGVARQADLDSFNRGLGQGRGNSQQQYDQNGRPVAAPANYQPPYLPPYRAPVGRNATGSADRPLTDEEWQGLFGQYGYGENAQPAEAPLSADDWEALFGQYGYGDNESQYNFAYDNSD